MQIIYAAITQKIKYQKLRKYITQNTQINYAIIMQTLRNVYA